MPLQYIAGRMARKTMEERAGLPLVAGEETLGELYVSTRDVRIRGFQWAGSGLDGKLVLTSYRLFYCFFDEKSTAFAIEPTDVDSVEQVPGRTLVPPKIVLTCRLPGDAATRRLTFKVPPAITIQQPGVLTTKHVSYKNPGTAADFAAALAGWQRDGGVTDSSLAAAIRAQRSRLVGAALVSDTRRAIARLTFALPLAFIALVGPVFGVLALRDARRLQARAEREGLDAPARLGWVRGLAWVWIVLGGLITALMAYGILSGR